MLFVLITVMCCCYLLTHACMYQNNELQIAFLIFTVMIFRFHKLFSIELVLFSINHKLTYINPLISINCTVRTYKAPVIPRDMDEWTIKTPNPTCRLFFKIYLLTDIAALCLTDFIDWRYIHSVVCIFDPTCELLPPWTKEQYLCTVAPLPYLLSDLPPFPN